MDATAILGRLGSLGISVEVANNRLLLQPGSRVPPDLVDELRAHKQEVILKLKGYRLKYSQASDREVEEIVARVEVEGCVLLWSTVLNDLVAFYRDEDARSKIPPGFVPYSVGELQELFGGGKQSPSQHTLRLIHEAKKQGGCIKSNQ